MYYSVTGLGLIKRKFIVRDGTDKMGQLTLH